VALVALTAAGTSACSKAEPVEASKWDIPAVVWDGGVAPSGGAEDSPWAKEYREAKFMKSYAGARKDASYAEYVQKFGYEVAVKDAESMAKGYDSFDDRDPESGDYVLDAPARWAAQRVLITSVTENSDGRSAVIEDCYVIYSVGSFHEEVICSAARLTHKDDGTISLEGVLSSELPAGADPAKPAVEPTVDEIPTARWATPITAPTLPGEVKKPLPREYYVKSGVISK
jgi:hypothetical protein